MIRWNSEADSTVWMKEDLEPWNSKSLIFMKRYCSEMGNCFRAFIFLGWMRRKMEFCPERIAWGFFFCLKNYWRSQRIGKRKVGPSKWMPSGTTESIFWLSKEKWGICSNIKEKGEAYYENISGAFEIPLIASKMAASGKYQAVICLGAVIRGSTSHRKGRDKS